MYTIEKNCVKRLSFMVPNSTCAVFHVSIYKEIRRFTRSIEQHKLDLIMGDYKEIPVEDLYLPIAYEVQKNGEWSDEYFLTEDQLNVLLKALEAEEFSIFDIPLEEYAK